MKNQFEEIIKIKTAISLRTLLRRNKTISQNKENKEAVADSYEKISINADIRKATVTLAFNGFTRTSMTTVILIIEAMGFGIRDFAEIYDKITDEDIINFKNEVMKR